MAFRLLKRSAQEVKQSPAAKRWVAEVVHSCVTTPFDHKAVRCLRESRQLTACLDDMVRRNPERREQATLLLQTLSRR